MNKNMIILKGGKGQIKKISMGKYSKNENANLRMFMFDGDLSTAAKKELIPFVLDKAGLGKYVAKASFSQRAGCSCGCSPGFIIKGIVGGEAIYVDLK
jgi:hypothetical protein